MSARADATTARDLVQRLVDSVNAAGLETLEEIASGQIAREAANWIGPFRRSFPDFRMDLVDVIAEDDRVVAHFKCAGTHLGDWQGRPPTGRRFHDIDEIYIFRIVDGQLDSLIAAVEDNLARLRQLGVRA